MSEVEKKNQTALAMQQEAPMGFEEDDERDLIIPRVKVIQTLSPERKEKMAEEGDIINSLTLDRLNGKVFIPVFKFPNNIDWLPRSDGGGIACQARDGKRGVDSAGNVKLCAQCMRHEFDNTKQGKEAIPKCTKYINFFGFIEGERVPLVLSFSKTGYNEGKKMYSLAKVTMQNMWHHGYKLSEKLMSKNGNEWFIIQPMPAGATCADDREFALGLFKNFRYTNLNIDIEDNVDTTHTVATPEEVASAEF